MALATVGQGGACITCLAPTSLKPGSPPGTGPVLENQWGKRHPWGHCAQSNPRRGRAQGLLSNPDLYLKHELPLGLPWSPLAAQHLAGARSVETQ